MTGEPFWAVLERIRRTTAPGGRNVVAVFTDRHPANKVVARRPG